MHFWRAFDCTTYVSLPFFDSLCPRPNFVSFVHRPQVPDPGDTVFCPQCGLQVFIAEAYIGPGKEWWHQKCFKCENCNRQLDPQTSRDHDSLVYCSACHARLFQTRGFSAALTHAWALTSISISGNVMYSMINCLIPRCWFHRKLDIQERCLRPRLFTARLVIRDFSKHVVFALH